jgi:rSAM/selenodomain-associated transferase 1
VHTLGTVDRFAKSRPGITARVAYEGAAANEMSAWLGDDRDYVAQSDGDLGERMSAAFADAFREGAGRVVVIGTDCPALSPDHLAEAFEALGNHEVVLGPARDGGYYLVGLSRPADALFTDIPWGTESVLQATMERAEAVGLTQCCLQTLGDVDRPEDLPLCREAFEDPELPAETPNRERGHDAVPSDEHAS